MSVRAKFQLPSKLRSGEINFPGWVGGGGGVSVVVGVGGGGGVAGLI